MPEELLEEDAPLSAEEILLFGPVVEAQVWTPTFIAEKRAPIAVAAGRPKLGPVFNSEGVGKAVLIRPCVSRGKRIRGLPPIYTPGMLEANAKVFAGWAMYLDHLPSGAAAAAKQAGRSVKEMGGQVLTPYWDGAFVQEGDYEFGYQPGGALAEIWATPYLRNLVGENPNLLHTSIAAWPTGGKVAKAPWNAGVKGMAIEGIRAQPQGSVDFVPRGGAGGRLLLKEGEDPGPDERPWPEPQLEADDERLVVSLAEAFYASPAMTGTASQPPDFASMTPQAFGVWIRENAPNLQTALREEAAPAPTAAAPAAAAPVLTEADVKALIVSESKGATTPEEVQELAEQLLVEREEQRELSRAAHELIEKAEGIPAAWKADLKARWAILPSGPQPALMVEADEAEGKSRMDLVIEGVKADLEHARDLIAEATGKPRVKGEGGATTTSTGSEKLKESTKGQTPYWRERFADMGIVESADDALGVHGVEKVEA